MALPEPTGKIPVIEPLDGLSLEEYAAQARFHRRFTYHSDTAKRELVASYSVIGNQESTAPTYLYLGGIYGGRYHGFWVDYLSKVKGVKGIFPDRPGLGLFSAVAFEQRVSVLLEAVPLILADAGVERVGLMALSGGAQYALDLLWHRPDLIMTDAPVFLLSPWVHPRKSGVRSHAFMSYVPASMTRSAASFASFVLKKLVANVKKEQKSGNFVHKRNEARVPTTCGGTPDEVERRRQFFARKLFAEDVTGSAEDYLLGIKDPKTSWGISADYEDFARQLSERYRTTGPRLKIQASFAANDGFIGNQGMEYFNTAFGSPIAQQGFDYESEIIEGTDHEGIAYPEIGVVGKMMDQLVEKWHGNGAADGVLHRDESEYL